MSSTSTNISLTSGTSSEIHLSSIGVPSTASTVLVFVEAGTGDTAKRDIYGHIEVYSKSSLKQFLSIFAYTSDDWAYNSDNLWVPIGANRIVYAKFKSSEAIKGYYYANMKVIGYKWTFYYYCSSVSNFRSYISLDDYNYY